MASPRCASCSSSSGICVCTETMNSAACVHASGSVQFGPLSSSVKSAPPEAVRVAGGTPLGPAGGCAGTSPPGASAAGGSAAASPAASDATAAPSAAGGACAADVPGAALRAEANFNASDSGSRPAGTDTSSALAGSELDMMRLPLRRDHTGRSKRLWRGIRTTTVLLAAALPLGASGARIGSTSQRSSSTSGVEFSRGGAMSTGRVVVSRGVKGGAASGAVYGVYAGVREARAAGLAGNTLVRSLAKRAVLTTAGFGVFMAVYTASLQQLERVRNGKRGLANSAVAGCVTGAVLALHTRRAPMIALSSAISGALMLGVDASLLSFELLARQAQARLAPHKATMSV